MRVGMGYDVHKLVEGRDLILGGVKIPYEKGLLGHSESIFRIQIRRTKVRPVSGFWKKWEE